MSARHDAMNELYGRHLADQVEKRLLQDEIAKLNAENSDLTETVRLLVVPGGIAVLQAENRALRDMLTAAQSNVRALLSANDELQSALKRLSHTTTRAVRLVTDEQVRH